MSKFKVGDTVRLINPAGWGGKSKGSIYKIAEVGRHTYDLDDGTVVAFMYERDFELAEDSAPVAGMGKFKFELGDDARVIKIDSDDKAKGIEIGDIVTVDEYSTVPFCITKKGRHVFRESQLELVEDRTNWHPHHDVIVAWAKGAKVQYDTLHGGGWSDWESSDKAPGFQREHKYRVKPEPDHTAEIADIERKMRELSESQKELADRLEKLK